MVLALAVALLLAPSLAQGQAGQGLEPRILDLYREAYRLARRGVDVSDIVHELDGALRLARQGRVEEATRLLEDASTRLERLSEQAGGILLRARLEKYLAVAVLASLPVITYLLFPRLYIQVWYRSRRRWVVEREA